MYINRASIVKEIRAANIRKNEVRKLIRERAKIVENQRKVIKEAVMKLLIKEMEEVPHRSTGINVLEDLLTKIIKTLEDDYKQLTTDPAQRESFRAHIINGIQNSLAPYRVVNAADADDDNEGIIDIDEELLMEALDLEEADVDIEVGDEETDSINDEDGIEPAPTDEDASPVDMGVLDDIDIETKPGEESKFIDIDKDNNDMEDDSFGIEGEESTGRNFAADTYNKIEKQIVSAFQKLGNDEDRDVFYDYLITNIKLYFDKFEDELQTILPEPTTDEYEKEKDNTDLEQSSTEQSLQ